MRYRYRIEPTLFQQALLARVFGCVRVVFNDALRIRDEAYRAGFKLSDSEIQRRVITRGQDDHRAGLAVRGTQRGVGAVGQRLAPRLAQLLRLGHRKRKGRKLGRPRMKSRKDHRQSFRLTRNGFAVRDNGRLYVAKVGEVRVRWSRDLPSDPSSVTIIRGTRWALSTRVSLSRCQHRRCRRPAERPGSMSASARLATVATTDGARTDVPNPNHLARKQRKLARLEREKSRRQKGSNNRNKTRRRVAVAHRRGGPCSAGLSPQAGIGVGSREPSDPRRRPQHRGNGQKPSPGSRDLGCGVGATHADHRREGRPLRTHRAHGVAVAGVEQNLLGMRAPTRRTASADPSVDVPRLRGDPRSRPQCRQKYSRRWAGGETKRLQSPRKTAIRCGNGC